MDKGRVTNLEAFLDSTKKLAEAAEGGEWYVVEVDEYPFHEPRQKVRYRTKFVDGAICEAFGGTGPRPKDAQFIAASRTRLPLALEMLEEAVSALRDIASWCPTPEDPDACKIAECKVARMALEKIEAKVKGTADA